MAERTPQQLERDLDTFWNALVAGEAPLPASAETAMVARLATSGDRTSTASGVPR